MNRLHKLLDLLVNDAETNIDEFTKVIDAWSLCFNIPYPVVYQAFEKGELEKLILDTRLKYKNIEMFDFKNDAAAE